MCRPRSRPIVVISVAEFAATGRVSIRDVPHVRGREDRAVRGAGQGRRAAGRWRRRGGRGRRRRGRRHGRWCWRWPGRRRRWWRGVGCRSASASPSGVGVGLGFGVGFGFGGFGRLEADFGSLPARYSTPSLQPSRSVSATRGLVPRFCSARLVRPSRSGFSRPSHRPSPSVSTCVGLSATGPLQGVRETVAIRVGRHGHCWSCDCALTRMAARTALTGRRPRRRWSSIPTSCRARRALGMPRSSRFTSPRGPVPARNDRIVRYALHRFHHVLPGLVGRIQRTTRRLRKGLEPLICGLFED